MSATKEAKDHSPTTASAEDFRLAGNQYFAQGDYDSALPLYSMAIDQAAGNSSVALHLCNRSACLLKMERYEEARADALEAVKHCDDSLAPKAVFRLARADIAMRNYKEAVEHLESFLRNNKDTSSVDNAQVVEIQKLLAFANKKQKEEQEVSAKKTTKPSIKDFELGSLLGEGNFSAIYSCRHKESNELFALKVIEKKKVESLGKREHPNVYNEVNMERRILGEILTEHPLVIKMHHSFQDYQNLYLLMDLHKTQGELWSRIRYQNKLVGCHASLVRFYLAELVEVLEYIHSKGIVHRDLKAENVLIAASGHIVLIDFGTAKDLIRTDLNGPDFVGTPDFMPPEAVRGTDDASPTSGADHTADLWGLGSVAFQLLTGDPPFSSQSPYLTFLKIQRGNLYRPMVITDDDAWDLITNLLQVDPHKRLGANCVPDECNSEMKKPLPGNLSAIKNHHFFVRGRKVDNKINASTYGGELSLSIGSLHLQPALKVPSLRDLCIRACAELTRLDSLNLDAPEPGDGSPHDMLRLNSSDRAKVMHILDRLLLLSEPRIFRRFFATKQDARLSRIRQSTHDFVGLTLREEGKPKEHENTSDDPAPIKIIHLTNPLFTPKAISDDANSENQRIENLELLKTCIRSINRIRPKFVVISGSIIDESCRNLIAKISETIPLVLCDGSNFLSVWHCCNEVLILCGRKLVSCSDRHAGVSAKPDDENDDQMAWLKEELEQISVPRRKPLAFTENDPRQLTQRNLKRLAKNGIVCVLGCSKDSYRTTYDLTEASDSDDDVDDSSESTPKDACDKLSINLISSTLTMLTMEAKYGNWTAEDITP